MIALCVALFMGVAIPAMWEFFWVKGFDRDVGNFFLPIILSYLSLVMFGSGLDVAGINEAWFIFGLGVLGYITIRQAQRLAKWLWPRGRILFSNWLNRRREIKLHEQEAYLQSHEGFKERCMKLATEAFATIPDEKYRKVLLQRAEAELRPIVAELALIPKLAKLFGDKSTDAIIAGAVDLANSWSSAVVTSEQDLGIIGSQAREAIEKGRLAYLARLKLAERTIARYELLKYEVASAGVVDAGDVANLEEALTRNTAELLGEIEAVTTPFDERRQKEFERRLIAASGGGQAGEEFLSDDSLSNKSARLTQ